jgi:transcriptional regulator GlxA family with amidase domain
VNIAVVLFDGAEELDWAGPWEVLAAWARIWPDDGVSVYTVAESLEPITCAKGLRVLADHTWDSAPSPDVVVWPGGVGAREQVGRADVRRRVRDLRDTGALMTSVCTGALVYADAGLLAGRPATTWHGRIDELAALGALPAPEERFVDDGDVVTAAGVSAGIDMALHLVARLHSVERAREVRRYIQYDPEPPV